MTDEEAAALNRKRDICLNLLEQARAAGGWRRRFLQFYGQVLDVETTAELRGLWGEIVAWKRRIPRRKP